MKLKNVILIFLILCIISFSIGCKVGDWDCPNTDGDGSGLGPSITTSPTNSNTPTTTPSTITPTPSIITPTPSNSSIAPTPSNSSIIPTPSNGGDSTEGEDGDDDNNASDTPKLPNGVKQNETDPFKYQSGGFTYAAYGIGGSCIIFIIVVLIKKYRAGRVTPINIDTANYSVLEMRD